MSDGFTIGAAMAASTLFECPQCNETIDSSAETCRFCGNTVDHEAALKAAAVLTKVNQACSDAKYMRSTAVAIPVFLLIRLVPFFGGVGVVGFYGLTVGVPVWALRWWIKFGKLASEDNEYVSARKSVRTIGIIVSATLAVFILIPIILAMASLYHPAVH
jgi:hypothetical protein